MKLETNLSEKKTVFVLKINIFFTKFILVLLKFESPGEIVDFYREKKEYLLHLSLINGTVVNRILFENLLLRLCCINPFDKETTTESYLYLPA